MTSPPQLPILLLPSPAPGAPPTKRAVRGGGPSLPRKARQIERLAPKFEELHSVFAARRVDVREDPSGVAPEEVLVLETVGSVKDLFEAIASVPGLEWLAESEERELAQDDDFHLPPKEGKPAEREKGLIGRLYLVMSNQRALGDILAFWKNWQTGKLQGPTFEPWRELFRHLREVRFWNVEDRLNETRVLEQWRERVREGYDTVPVEIDLWFRAQALRAQAEQRVRAIVEHSGGTVLDTMQDDAIGYHGLLATVPISLVERILEDRGVELLRCEDVRFFRPVGQSAPPVGDTESLPEEPVVEAPALRGQPVVALLDGLPLENHPWLAGRLIVDDPDGWAADYPADARNHGTAMASLIVQGDRSEETPALPSPLYVRPVLRPDPGARAFGKWKERVPEEHLWVDLVHRAVQRVLQGDAETPAAAPSVCVFNFSIGDTEQPFDRTLSPMARLLDWLAWRYKVLFIVSAGNVEENQLALVPTAQAGAAGSTGDHNENVLRSIAATARHRRLATPAEAVNVLTIGAQHTDAAGAWTPKSSGDQLLFTLDDLPSPTSRLGRGFRRAIKPDVFYPGGRHVVRPSPAGTNATPTLVYLRTPSFPPGQKVAAPGRRPGDVGGFRYTHGTSNATALASRAAAQLAAVLDRLRTEPGGNTLDAVPRALHLKALLAHSASWSGEAWALAERTLKTPQNSRTFRDHVTSFLGYGNASSDRVMACLSTRVTMLGGGKLRAGGSHLHRIPAPPSLSAQKVWRRLTVTLAWFTPINPGHRAYRRARLWFEQPAENHPLLVTREDADSKAALRGTLQHEVFEGDKASVFLDGDYLHIPVHCAADAGELEDEVPYALAVTLEVAPATALPLYEEVRVRLRQRQRIQPPR